MQYCVDSVYYFRGIGITVFQKGLFLKRDLLLNKVWACIKGNCEKTQQVFRNKNQTLLCEESKI